jgi:hypothetical protein
MPGKYRATVASLVIAIASISLIVTDDAFARGCGGGRHRNQQRQQDDQGSGTGEGHHDDGNDNSNGGHRRNRNRNNQNANDGEGHHREGWRPHRRFNRGDTGPDREIGLGVGGTYGVPGGRIGPPTRPCMESQHAQATLNRLKNLYNQVDSGQRVVVSPYLSNESVVKVARLRREIEQRALVSGDTTQLNSFNHDIAALRERNLESLNAQIREVDGRLGELAADCR